MRNQHLSVSKQNEGWITEEELEDYEYVKYLKDLFKQAYEK